MSKDKEKLLDVELTENGEKKTVKILVKRPNNATLSQAQRVSAKTWTDCVRDGIMTKKELEKFMKEHNVWNETKDQEQKDKIREIAELEKQLFVQGNNGKLRASEGKDIAIKMRIARNELRNLIAEKIALEQNTAEALSDNARFDFLVSSCTFDQNGNKVYKDVDDYAIKSDSEIAFAAASALAQMLYAVDKDFESKLPENKFLKMFHFVDEDLTLVNKEGEYVDTEGRRIDKNGFYINDEDKRVDKEGNLLDEFGNYVPSVTYIDDEGNEIDDSSEKKVTKKKKTKETSTDSE
jgi:hypothetical protein